MILKAIVAIAVNDSNNIDVCFQQQANAAINTSSVVLSKATADIRG